MVIKINEIKTIKEQKCTNCQYIWSSLDRAFKGLGGRIIVYDYYCLALDRKPMESFRKYQLDKNQINKPNTCKYWLQRDKDYLEYIEKLYSSF